MKHYKNIIVGTRNSKLAIAQTKQIINKLKNKHPKINFIIKKIKSDGDNNLDIKKKSITGIFVKKLQKSILEKKIDIAIHSLKDVPTKNNIKLILASFPKRETPEDILLFKNSKIKIKFCYYYFLNLFKMNTKKIIIGTSSERRKYQIKKKYPFCEIKLLRGNIDSRIKKLKNINYDAIILAKAGLERLSINGDSIKKLNKKYFIPAPGQGSLVIETRKEKEIINIVNSINHNYTKKIVFIERKIMKKLEAGCKIPLGCYVDSNKKYYFVNIFYYKNEYFTIKKKILLTEIEKFIENLDKCFM